jgi:hypothetical protein
MNGQTDRSFFCGHTLKYGGNMAVMAVFSIILFIFAENGGWYDEGRIDGDAEAAGRAHIGVQKDFAGEFRPGQVF